jgi:hypothetical protein
MTETLDEPATPSAEEERTAELELRRKNMRWGWALLGLFILLFGGTAGVAFIYLWLS